MEMLPATTAAAELWLAWQFVADYQVNQEGSIVGQGLLDGRSCLFGPLNFEAGYAHRPGQRGKVDNRIGQFERFWEGAWVKALFLPILFDIELEQLVALVIADYKLGADVVVGGGPQGLDGVHTSAVTAEANDRFIGVSQLGS